MTSLLEAGAEAAPPSPRVRARTALTAGTLRDRGELEPGTAAAGAAERLLVRRRAASIEHAGLLRDVATLWIDRGDDQDGDREEADLTVAIAVRTTTAHASSLLRDAHMALTDLPRTFSRLEDGDMPVEWFDRMLRRLRDLTATQRHQIDDRVATWDLASIPAERFRRELNLLIAWFPDHLGTNDAQQQRDVALEMPQVADGTADLRITGPVPEILVTSRRLDAAARAVQDQQRRALAEDRPVPFDIDGTAARAGRPLPLSALRYAIITRSTLDTGGIEVDRERFRINVVVPVMTLLGLSQAPATLDGTIPLPADLARTLAADEPTWYRVLTDPVDGTFIPAPAGQYRPTAAMAEHLRLRHPVCAAPGCARSTSSIGENDHIEEYDHSEPARGGPTSIDNLHRLCRLHHRLKTLHLIDPVRGPDDPTATRWTTRSGARTRATHDCDLTTPRLAAALHERWEEYLWLRDIDAMYATGEADRLQRENGPHDDHDTPARRRSQRPPY